VRPRKPANATVDSIIRRHTNMLSTDETGIANTLYNDVAIDMLLVSNVFFALSRDYSTDADDVARIYIDHIKHGGGSVQHALKRDTKLKQQLIDILDDGWTTGSEKAQIGYLRSL